MSDGTPTRLIFDAGLKAAREHFSATLPHEASDSGIPIDFKRSKVYLPKLETLSVPLPDDVRRRLRSLAGGSPLLTYTALLAALAITLRRYTRADTIIVGSPAALVEGEAEPTPNLLAIATALDDELPFRELLQRLRKSLVAAYEHQRYPFDAVLDDLGITAPPDRGALFDVVASLEGLHGPLPPSKHDVTLAARGRTVEELCLEVTFNARLLRRETVSAFTRSYLCLLASALEHPSSPSSALQILSPEDEREILEVSRGPAAASVLGVLEAFEAQVDRTPDAIAIEHQGQRSSYRELDEQASRLAHLLRSEGAGPRVPVGISMVPGVDLLVGLLAILKAGAAYLPLDPAHPRDRVALMIDDARLDLIVTHPAARERLASSQARVLCVHEQRAAIAQRPAARAAGPELDDLAYVLFTSGSTGRPKGVCMPHRGLGNLVQWQRRRSRLAAGARTLMRTSIGFDVSAQEIFATLCVGGTLVVVPEDARNELWQLPQLLADERIERVFLPFVALQQLAEAMTVQGRFPATLREIITAGEQLRITPPIMDVFRQLEGCSLDNHYGPTETHVVTAFELAGPAIRWPALPPIGRPIDGARVYLLDAALRPVPLGAIGEIYVGGVPLARGYLGQPELTAERFPPSPFEDEPDARLYRTGDLARRRREGDIEFLGRVDRQVKIRGHRVELGEVEAVLSQHPAVREVVAMGHADATGELRLVAWMVPAHGELPSGADLRGFLEPKLAPAMIPALFVRLDALPLTPTGKVDHRALPAPDWAHPELADGSARARTPTEELLARIWCEVLGVERVGITDNFLSLRGDSILATQVVAKASEAGLALTVRDVFQHQTIGELALVAAAREAPVAIDEPCIEGPVPLTAIQQWWFEQELPNPNHWNMGVLLETPGVLELGMVEQAMQAVVAHHEALLLRFPSDGAGRRQQVGGAAPAQALSVVRVDLSALAPDEQRLALAERVAALQTTLDIEDGPLVLVAVLDLGAGRPGRLLFTAHHLVMDGVSLRTVIADLETAYLQLTRHEPVVLPARTSSFVRWAQLAHAFARSARARDELELWTRSPVPVPTLPRDFPEGPNPEGSARTLQLALSVEHTRALLEVVPQAHGARVDEVLLTALSLALCQWTGASSAFIDVEAHGREPVVGGGSTARTVGWFTSLFPVRLELGVAPSPAEALHAVHAQLGRVPNHGLGYGMLRYLGEPAVAARLAALPRPEVSFNYLGQFDQQLSGSSLFSLAREDAGPLCDPRGERAHLLYVGGRIVHGQLHIELRHGQQVHRASTIDGLAQRMLDALQSIIHAPLAEPLAAPRTMPHTTAKVSPAELDAIVATVRGPRGDRE